MNNLVLLCWVALVDVALTEAQQFSFKTFAGPASGYGSSDGVGKEARFNYPFAVATEHSGNIYVADSNNHSIRKISAIGVVSTLAGSSERTVGEVTDGTGSVARFAHPNGVATDAAGNIYVADTDNGTIRRITPAGVVTTLAGRVGEFGSADGPGSTARFRSPTSVAVDGFNNVYVADRLNHTIRRITPDGIVSTLAGQAGNPGTADGTGVAAHFNYPALTVDAAGTAYVADWGNHTIRKITPEGIVTTLAGLAGSSGSSNGEGREARFHGPQGVAVGAAGSIYVADSGNHLIRKISPTGTVTTLAGLASVPGSDDGTGGSARFNYPTGVALDSANNVYVADAANHMIRKITPDGVVTTLAGMAGGGENLEETGRVDGVSSEARFFGPRGLALDGQRNVYVADSDNQTIRKINSVGVVSTLAGTAGSGGDENGMGSAARFLDPTGVAVDSAGNLYVAEASGQTIRKITSLGTVSTFAGRSATPGSDDGPSDQARFNTPIDLATDATGTIYVADSGNNTIRKISPTQVVSTFAGKAGQIGSADGVGSEARFNYPFGIAVDEALNVYVADIGNGTVRRISPGGVVSTLAGLAGAFGNTDGTGSTARFGGCNGLGCGGPSDVAVDHDGFVYVTDWPATIRRIGPNGKVSTLAGLANKTGSEDGTGITARFRVPRGLALDSAGTLYIADTGNHTIRVGTRVFGDRPRFTANSLKLPAGQFQIETAASSDQLVIIQASTSIPSTNWSTLQSVTLRTGRTIVTDPDAANFPRRFYRAISPEP
ncbi:MAG: hypothetical protein U1G07_18755 [Verrucomicrobiota bacterium]